MYQRTLLSSLVAISMTTLAASAAFAQDAGDVGMPPPTEPPPETTSPVAEPPPPPTPTPPPAITSATPTESACAEHVYASARASVVRVESGTRVGSGFLVVDASHVITSFRLVRDGHGVRVVDPDGNARNANVINTAQDDDLAMLELASPLPGTPLEIATWETVQVGQPVVALSQSMIGVRHQRVMGGPQTEGLFDWAVAAGVIAAVGDRAIQTDIQLDGGSNGGPILDCSGHVVATVSIAMAGFDQVLYLGAAVPALADLTSRTSHPEGYGGRVAFTFGLGLSTAFEDPGWVYGGYLQVGLTALDAFVLSGRFHYLMRMDQPTGSGTLSSTTDRLRGDAYAGWRQLVTLGPGMGFHFELGVGASVSSVHDTARVATIDAMGSIRINSTDHQLWAVRPMAVLNLQFGWLQISYSLEWDTTRMNAMHLFDLGLRF
jgi:S1-C subfamily serine protease